MKKVNYKSIDIVKKKDWWLTQNQISLDINWFDTELTKTITKDVRFGHLFDSAKLELLKHSVKLKTVRNLRTKKALCVESGRPRGFNRFTGLSRFRFKEFVERGILPGMYRASW